MNLFDEIKKKYHCLNPVTDISSGKKIIYLSPVTYIYFRKKMIYIKNIDYIYFDGTFITTILRILGIKIQCSQSFDFSSMATPFFLEIERTGKMLFIIGANQEELIFFIHTVKKRHPLIKITGAINGYFDHQSNDKIKEIAESIKKVKSDFVLVGMGAQKQEEFVSNISKFLPKTTMLTCGAFISQTSISADYFPEIYRILHLRWLIRFIKEPKIIKRTLFNYPKFILFIFLDWLRSNQT